MRVNLWLSAARHCSEHKRTYERFLSSPERTGIRSRIAAASIHILTGILSRRERTLMEGCLGARRDRARRYRFPLDAAPFRSSATAARVHSQSGCFNADLCSLECIALAMRVAQLALDVGRPGPHGRCVGRVHSSCPHRFSIQHWVIAVGRGRTRPTRGITADLAIVD